MHHSIWLASVGLLATSVSAFFPYDKPVSSTSKKSSDSGSKHRRFYSLPNGVGAEHEESGVVTMDIKRRPTKVSQLSGSP